MRRSKQRVPAAALLALLLALAITGCSAEGPQSTAPAGGGTAGAPPMDQDSTVGVLLAVNGNTLALQQMGNMQGMGQAPPDGAPPEMGSLPEGQPPAGGPPAGSLPPTDGGEPPEGGMFPGAAPDGEELEITVDSATTITAADGGSLTLEELEAGAMLAVSLAEDGKTAVSIAVLRPLQQTEGEQGA